jgi:hypothetical protein
MRNVKKVRAQSPSSGGRSGGYAASAGGAPTLHRFAFALPAPADA